MCNFTPGSLVKYLFSCPEVFVAQHSSVSRMWWGGRSMALVLWLDWQHGDDYNDLPRICPSFGLASAHRLLF
jgi:hypothetical protein